MVSCGFLRVLWLPNWNFRVHYMSDSQYSLSIPCQLYKKSIKWLRMTSINSQGSSKLNLTLWNKKPCNKLSPSNSNSIFWIYYDWNDSGFKSFYWIFIQLAWYTDRILRIRHVVNPKISIWQSQNPKKVAQSQKLRNLKFRITFSYPGNNFCFVRLFTFRGNLEKPWLGSLGNHFQLLFVCKNLILMCEHLQYW